ncbi:MAG: hypothetical protein NTY35_09715 [Planctomycetota bacterium]|nr:hypothetical protein [Planctomycetota bacterium]
MLRVAPIFLVLAAPSALATDVVPTVLASTHDAPVDGTADSFNGSPFEGLIRLVSSQEDRAIQEYSVAAFTGQTVMSATLTGTVAVNNAFDNGVRTFEFRLYAGNGAADLSDHSIAAVLVGTGSYHPPMQTSFAYSFDVTSQVAALLGGGATWIGLRVQATSNPNFPNILDVGITTKLAIDVSPTTGAGYCFGDGSATACPCGNASAPGSDQGCLNSLGAGGTLRGDGLASVSNDGFTLRGAGMPNSSALYFQGTSVLGGGNGSTFGDGLRCVSGSVIRLGTKSNVAGASQYPAAGDPPVSVRGLVPPAGGSFYYQVWYRNAAAFCTTSTFNLSNGWSVVWAP